MFDWKTTSIANDTHIVNELRVFLFLLLLLLLRVEINGFVEKPQKHVSSEEWKETTATTSYQKPITATLFGSSIERSEQSNCDEQTNVDIIFKQGTISLNSSVKLVEFAREHPFKTSESNYTFDNRQSVYFHSIVLLSSVYCCFSSCVYRFSFRCH